MFFSLILENAAGDQMDMTATANQYMSSQIEGLSPPPGTISTSSYAGMDGSYLNNAFIEKRNVVIIIGILLSIPESFLIVTFVTTTIPHFSRKIHTFHLISAEALNSFSRLGRSQQELASV